LGGYSVVRISGTELHGKQLPWFDTFNKFSSHIEWTPFSPRPSTPAILFTQALLTITTWWSLATTPWDGGRSPGVVASGCSSEQGFGRRVCTVQRLLSAEST
jgi:hypothetical protein